MFRITKVVFLFSILMSMSNVGFADQRCRSVDVRYDNQVGRSIKILSFKYWDAEDNKWRNEDVGNFFQIQDATSGFSNQTLEYVGNEEISAFRVRFKWCGTQDAAGQCSLWQQGSLLSDVTVGVPYVSTCRRNMDLTIPVRYTP